jgi:curved DNA-binding protein CbpA
MSYQIADPYAVLGVPRNATNDQIRQAYRRLAMRYHPDLHPAERTSERMRRLNEAWQILASPVSRQRYDAGIRHMPSQPTARAEPAPNPGGGPGLAGALGILAVGWLVLATIFVGFLPAPIIGLALLAAARLVLGGILRR